MRLLSKNKVRLLKLFYAHPEQQFYIQEIGRLLGKKPGVFQRELNNLYKDGILLSEYKANARFFRANKGHVIYSELKSIVSKSAKLCLILSLLCLSCLYAQDEPLTLKSAILIAFKNNKDIQIQEQDVEFDKANIVDSRSRFLPSLNLNAAYTRNASNLRVNIAGAKKDIGVFTGYKNDNLVGLSLNESIYNGGADIATFQQAKLSLKASEETLRAKKLDVEFEAKRLYYGLLLAYESERIAKDLVGQAREHYNNVEDKFEHGTASRFDVLQSKVQVSLLEPQLVAAGNDVNYIKAELNKLFSRKVDNPVDTQEKLDYTPVEIREEEFLKTAYLNKPEMILKSLGIDISKWGVDLAHSGMRPQVDASAVYSYRSNNPSRMFNVKHNNWNAGLSVTIPIFDGFSTKAKVSEAKSRYAQAVLDKDNTSDQIAVDIRKGCLDLREAETVIISQKDNVGEAIEALRIAEVSYDNGVAINLDVLDAQVSLAQIQKNLAEGIYNYLMAKAYLDRNMAESFIKEANNEKSIK
jgi:outer membrane protein